MKKTLVLLLLLCMMVLTACGNQGEQSGEANNDVVQQEEEISQTDDAQTDNQQITTANANITVESCRFAEEVRAIDGEFAGTVYQDIDGKVYVDVVMKVSDNTREMTSDDFSGYVLYNELRYDLQYCIEGNTASFVNEDNVPAKTGGRVHLFTSLPSEAVDGESLTVAITVDGKEYSCDVAPAVANNNPLDAKTEVKKGDKNSVTGGQIQFEVMDCKQVMYLRASDAANSKQYAAGGLMIDCVLKVTNQGTEPWQDILGYTIDDDTITRATFKIETENNTALDFWPSSSLGVESGKTEYIHIIADAEKANDNIVRFNLGGECFYCKAS